MIDSKRLKSPSGGDRVRRRVIQPTLHEGLMERIVDRTNVFTAWKRVKANKGSPGVDGMSIDDFLGYSRDHWSGIRQALLEGLYAPQPVKGVTIPKPNGGERKLGIPTVVDRVIQQAIGQILTPIFDPGFSESSFGFRPGRSAHGGLRQVQRYIREGYRIAVDLDLEKFFDKVNHDILMDRVARRVRDKRLLALIGRYLRAGVRVGEEIEARVMGTPQGGPLSPLLANILLDDLDLMLERRGHRFVRYADDLLIMVRSQRAGERVKTGITRFLSRKLKLAVNEKKSRVVKTNDCLFLGFTFRGVKLRWSDKAFADLKYNIRRLTGRSWGVSMAYRLDQLARYVRGWMNYFGISDYYRPIPVIDHWMRRRIRMCYWKQWRYTRTKVRNLLALGTYKRQAIMTAISSKSYWHLSKTLATQTGMTNAWLKGQGLLSVRDLWMRAHGYH